MAVHGDGYRARGGRTIEGAGQQRVEQRSAAILLGGEGVDERVTVDLGAGGNEPRDHVDRAVAGLLVGRGVQRGIAHRERERRLVLVLQIHVGAGLEQRLDDGATLGPRGVAQRDHQDRLALRRLRARAGALAEDARDRLGRARGHRLGERRLVRALREQEARHRVVLVGRHERRDREVLVFLGAHAVREEPTDQRGAARLRGVLERAVQVHALREERLHPALVAGRRRLEERDAVGLRDAGLRARLGRRALLGLRNRRHHLRGLRGGSGLRRRLRRVSPACAERARPQQDGADSHDDGDLGSGRVAHPGCYG